MKESIINYLKEHGKSSVNDIAQALNHAGGEKFPQLIKAISAMESKGQLRFNRDGSVSLRPKKENPNQVTVEGVFRANKNGFGFLHVDDSEDDMFVMMLAMPLTVILLPLSSRNQQIVCVGQQQKHELLKL